MDAFPDQPLAIVLMPQGVVLSTQFATRPEFLSSETGRRRRRPLQSATWSFWVSFFSPLGCSVPVSLPSTAAGCGE